MAKRIIMTKDDVAKIIVNHSTYAKMEEKGDYIFDFLETVGAHVAISSELQHGQVVMCNMFGEVLLNEHINLVH